MQTRRDSSTDEPMGRLERAADPVASRRELDLGRMRVVWGYGMLGICVRMDDDDDGGWAVLFLQRGDGSRR